MGFFWHQKRHDVMGTHQRGDFQCVQSIAESSKHLENQPIWKVGTNKADERSFTRSRGSGRGNGTATFRGFKHQVIAGWWFLQIGVKIKNISKPPR